MALSSKELEELADNLLSGDLTEKRKNKVKTAEYPILSDSQMRRRQSREIPLSNLSGKQRLECRTKNLDYSQDGDS
jgi:hypothetical protein